MDHIRAFLHTPHHIISALVRDLPPNVCHPRSAREAGEPYNASAILHTHNPTKLYDSFNDERTGIVHQAVTAHQRLTIQQAYATHLPRLATWWRDEATRFIPSLTTTNATLQLPITADYGPCVLLASPFPAPLLAVRCKGMVTSPCLTTMLAILVVLSWQDDAHTPGPLSPDAITTLMMAQGTQWTSVFHADPTFPPTIAPFVERLRTWVPRLTGTPIPYPSAAR